MALHLALLADYAPAVRDAVAALTRTFGADFADVVYGDSRQLREVRQSIDHADVTQNEFVALVIAKNVSAEPDTEGETGAGSRFATVTFANEIWLGQQASDGEGEDEFLSRFARLSLWWAAVPHIDVTVDDVEVRFEVGDVATVAEIDNDTGERERAGLLAAVRVEVFVRGVCRYES
jgi:hypothetical protein